MNPFPYPWQALKHSLGLGVAGLSLVAGVAEDAHVVRCRQATILERDDVGHVYLRDWGVVQVTDLTDTAAAELAGVVVTASDGFLEGRVLSVGAATANHSFTSYSTSIGSGLDSTMKLMVTCWAEMEGFSLALSSLSVPVPA